MYNLLWYFIIYAFLGWCCEVVFAAFKHKKFVNRGFLNGAFCPIYGFGVVFVVLILTPLKFNFVLLFLCSIVLTSALELITGFLMEKLFNQRWWDYSGRRFNIKGYICLEFSVLWGVACVIIMFLLHPLIAKLVSIVPKFIGLPIVLILITGIIVDAVYTIVCVNKMNKSLKKIDEFTKAMRAISDSIGDNLAESTLNLIEKNESIKSEIKEKNEKKKQELQIKLDELQNKKELLLKRLHYSHRFIKAFPNATHTKYSDAFEELKKKLKEYKFKN